jgi:mono/diheme cytochrome c family protein
MQRHLQTAPAPQTTTTQPACILATPPKQKSIATCGGLLIPGWLALMLVVSAGSVATSASAFAEDQQATPEVVKKSDSASASDVSKRALEILRTHCISCHGADTQESALRLDRRKSLLRGGDSGEPAVVPGHSEQSHLMQLITEKDRSRSMPPEGQPLLFDEEVAALRIWIDEPAELDEDHADNAKQNHWSFQPVRRIDPPRTDGADTVDDKTVPEIDRFIRAALQKNGLTPSVPAEPRVLIRRLWLDVLGLPPDPQTMARLEKRLREEGDAGWSRTVDEVLMNPQYGERWAVYWLDLVRFGETNGYETNRERPNAWPYRDYVIRSFNSDLPYDQFLREQIAGDALGVPEATGFLVAGLRDIVKSPDISLTLMQRHNELDDMIGTTGTAFLGLTIGCARCHNHKFDPIRQTDYYALQAIFAGVQHGDSQLPLSETTQKEIAELDRRIAVLKEQLTTFRKQPAGMRDPVNARRNEEHFATRTARSIRFTIRNTSGSEPCLDELEVFSGSRNVALASEGTAAESSGNLPGFEIHQLKQVNDGLYGNSHSWISNESGKGWVQLNFARLQPIDSIIWSRDRDGQFADRIPTDYLIELKDDSGQWNPIASSADRKPFVSGNPAEPEYTFDGKPEAQAEQGRLWFEELQKCKQERAGLATSTSVYAGKFEQPGTTRRLFRGDPMAPREEVSPNTVAFLGKLELSKDTSEQQRRVALAGWIGSKENPLTARVIVNRLWQYHFGRGLVGTPSDFGHGGVTPSHPELLDWLASELMDHNWSLKHIQRLILNSAVFRQSGSPREDALAIDAGCQWLWRFPPRRLDAEVIRDSIVSVSGRLNPLMSGPGFSVFEVQMENVRHYFPKTTFGESEWRRAVYMTRVRQQKDAVFGVFDCPDAASSVPARSRSTTPLQALNLFNSEFVLQQADLMAERLKNDEPTGTESQIRRAFQLCYGRDPESDELKDSAEFISEHGLASFCRVILNSNEFLFLP